VTESQVVREWTAKAREESERKGRREAKVEYLVSFLRGRFGEVPESLQQAIARTQDQEQLDSWVPIAATARSIAHFQEQTGL
jgi:hypothetical protein